MNQNIITELVCIDCGANLMRDLAEDGALFDTAKGNDTTSSAPCGFDCDALVVQGGDYKSHRIEIEDVDAWMN